MLLYMYNGRISIVAGHCFGFTLDASLIVRTSLTGVHISLLKIHVVTVAMKSIPQSETGLLIAKTKQTKNPAWSSSDQKSATKFIWPNLIIHVISEKNTLKTSKKCCLHLPSMLPIHIHHH